MSRFSGKIYKNSDILKLADVPEKNYGNTNYVHKLDILVNNKMPSKLRSAFEKAAFSVGNDIVLYIEKNKSFLGNMVHFIPAVEDMKHISWFSSKPIKPSQIDAIDKYLQSRFDEWPILKKYGQKQFKWNQPK